MDSPVIDKDHEDLESEEIVEESAFAPFGKFFDDDLFMLIYTNPGVLSAIQAAMQAARSGELQPVKRGSSIGRMGFLKSEVARYFGDPVLAAGISLKALSQITGWKGETLRHWIDEGFLKTEQVKLPGQQRDVVLPEHLLEFGQTYIPLADLAKIMDTKAAALSRNFKGTLETVGALPLANGQRRGGLIRIADLAKLALAHVKS